MSIKLRQKEVKGFEKLSKAKKSNYINYRIKLIAPTIYVDSEGKPYQSNLKEIKRRYETEVSFMNAQEDKRFEVFKKIAKLENNEHYLGLLGKETRTEDEAKIIKIYIREIEEAYNELPSIERSIRDIKRSIKACYPKELLEYIKQNLITEGNV